MFVFVKISKDQKWFLPKKLKNGKNLKISVHIFVVDTKKKFWAQKFFSIFRNYFSKSDANIFVGKKSTFVQKNYLDGTVFEYSEMTILQLYSTQKRTDVDFSRWMKTMFHDICQMNRLINVFDLDTIKNMIFLYQSDNKLCI